MTLFWQYFRAQRNALLVWLAVMMLMAVAVGAAAKGIESSNLMEQLSARLPAGLQALMGVVPGLSVVDSYIDAKLGFMLGLILSAYGCLMAIGAVTREVDRGSVDFLLSLPVERWRLLVARWGVMATNLAIVLLGTWAALVPTLNAQGVVPNTAGYFWMMAQTWFLCVCLGSLTMLGSLWIDEYGTAVKYSLAGLGLLFSIDVALRVANVGKLGRGFNPFAYLEIAQTMLHRHLLWGDALVLLAASMLALWLATRVFARKEIHA